MPAYHSVRFLFNQDVIYPNFVEDIYSAFFKNGIEFKSGFWFHKDASLQEIIDWNQRLLEKKFKLGYTQHVKHDYMQLLIDTKEFKEMRLFWLYHEKEFELSQIIPEDDIVNYGNSWKFHKDKLQVIIDIAKNVWSTGLVTLVQSHLEEGCGISLSEVLSGHNPSIIPFCIAKNELFDNFSGKLPDKLEIKSVSNSGTLILDKTWVMGY